jgi:glycosyltransferase involved in cell wall biosynthesis
MRICFFQIVPHYGGAAKSCIEMCTRLLIQAEVRLIDPYGCSQPFISQLKTNHIPYSVLLPSQDGRYIGGWHSPLARLFQMAVAYPHLKKLAKRLVDAVKAFKPDVICTDNLKSAYILSQAKAIAGIPVVYYLRGWFRPSQINMVGRRLCLKHAAGIIAVSYATQSALICSGVPSSKMFILHNPIDAQELARQSDQPLTSPLPGAELPIRLLVPAGIMYAKGQHTAVRAVKRLLEMDRCTVLWIAGDHQTIDPNRPYLDDLRRMVEHLGMQGHVFFIGLRNDIAQVMKAATHVVLPSHSEGHPRVILEAMALKKPMLSTPAGGCLDMVIPGLTGRLFNFERWDELAMGVADAVQDPEKTNAMVQRAFNWVISDFTPATHSAKLMGIFGEILAKKKVADQS